MKLVFRLWNDTVDKMRFRKQGYGVEGKEREFWKAEDYFERMVWRCYCEQHGFMFLGGEVEGAVDKVACRRLGIQAFLGLDGMVEEELTWTVRRIGEALGVS
jgi:nicotinamide/nicotinate riboside kinase